MIATTTVNTQGLDLLIGRVRALTMIDFSPLMIEWRTILEEDNVEGAMAGLDGFGNPLEPVTYRPDPRAGSRKTIDMTELVNGNLSSQAYRTLDGPPLAPRGLDSRIVTHFETAHGREANPDEWYALGAWKDVLSIASVPFLPFHFRGEGNLPVRDLAHVRPTAMAKARQALRDFVNGILRGQGIK